MDNPFRNIGRPVHAGKSGSVSAPGVISRHP